MYAVIETGGKQYIVSEGLILDVEKLDAEKTVTFDNVLMVFDDKESHIGAPTLKNATVKASILEQKRDDKITVFKYKRKTGYKVTQGHRQSISIIKIDKISLKKETAAKKTAEKKPTEKAASKTAEKA